MNLTKLPKHIAEAIEKGPQYRSLLAARLNALETPAEFAHRILLMGVEECADIAKDYTIAGKVIAEHQLTAFGLEKT